MRFDHAFDGYPAPIRIGQIALDVALWVDDDGATGRLVPHQVGRVGQTFQVVLLEDHRLLWALPNLARNFP
jgi:hypothetical protein